MSEEIERFGLDEPLKYVDEIDTNDKERERKYRERFNYQGLLFSVIRSALTDMSMGGTGESAVYNLWSILTRDFKASLRTQYLWFRERIQEVERLVDSEIRRVLGWYPPIPEYDSLLPVNRKTYWEEIKRGRMPSLSYTELELLKRKHPRLYKYREQRIKEMKRAIVRRFLNAVMDLLDEYGMLLSEERQLDVGGDS